MAKERTIIAPHLISQYTLIFSVLSLFKMFFKIKYPIRMVLLLFSQLMLYRNYYCAYKTGIVAILSVVHTIKLKSKLRVVYIYLWSSKTRKNGLSIFIVCVNTLLTLVNNLSKTRN